MLGLTQIFSRFYAVQVPLKIYSLPGRYATALYTASVKSGKLNDVDVELQKVKSFVAKSEEMQRFLENPSINRELKRQYVVSTLSKQKYSELVMNLFKTIADNGRLDYTGKIITAFEQIMKQHKAEINVSVISNRTLPADAQEKLTSIITKKFVEKEKKPKFNWRVDEKLLGGLKVEIGDNVIDLSVATKTNNLRDELTKSL